MVYEDIFDAKNACDHLSGFNVCNRYLVVLYYNANRVSISHSPHCRGSMLRINIPEKEEYTRNSCLASAIGKIHLIIDQ